MEKVRKIMKNEIRPNWLNIFVWLIVIPALCAGSWYGIFKFAQWLL